MPAPKKLVGWAPLGRPWQHRVAMMKTMVTQLLEKERIRTTGAKARALQRYADRVISIGKEIHDITGISVQDPRHQGVSVQGDAPLVYSDQLPEEHEGPLLEVAMAQHLLVAADQYQLVRLRKICERRLCESVDVETVATTLALAEQNHAEELKKVCLDFVSRNLAAVMNADGFRHMTGSCPQLQAEILSTIAANGSNISGAGNPGGGATWTWLIKPSQSTARILSTIAANGSNISGAGNPGGERHGHGPSNRVNVRMRETGKGDDGHRVRMRRDR
eukprot:gene22715-29876_t